MLTFSLNKIYVSLIKSTKELLRNTFKKRNVYDCIRKRIFNYWNYKCFPQYEVSASAKKIILVTLRYKHFLLRKITATLFQKFQQTPKFTFLCCIYSFIFFCFVQKCQSRNEHHLLNSYKTFRVHCIVTLFRYVVRLLYLHHRLAVVHHEFSKKRIMILPLSISYTKNYSATT